MRSLLPKAELRPDGSEMAKDVIAFYFVLFCCIIACVRVASAQEYTLDKYGEGVCRNRTSVMESVAITVTFRDKRTTTTQTNCGWWPWSTCSTKPKTVYYTAYRREMRPTSKPMVLLTCCEGYLQIKNACVPDCNVTNCTESCTNCPKGHAQYCNRLTGKCHCQPGYFRLNNTCQACSDGWYGMNCTLGCRCQGNSSHCDVISGACRCAPGKKGTFCENACEPLKWGSGCPNYCNCSTNPCNSENGTCDCGNDMQSRGVVRKGDGFQWHRGRSPTSKC